MSDDHAPRTADDHAKAMAHLEATAVDQKARAKAEKANAKLDAALEAQDGLRETPES